jgi:hypothetical protein
MRRGFGLLLLLGWIAAGSGCASASKAKNYTPAVPRFFLEVQGQASGDELTLPRSGVKIIANAKPVLTETDITAVELVQVELGKCLGFQLSPTAARDFYRMSVVAQGRRLVVSINDTPLGARRIDGPIADGVVFVFVELADEILPELVTNLKATIVDLQREVKKKG